MLDRIRWLQNQDGSKTLQARYDPMTEWFDARGDDGRIVEAAVDIIQQELYENYIEKLMDDAPLIKEGETKNG